MGGREAEMTFGIGEFDYSELFGDARTVATGLPNAGATGKLNILTFRCCIWTGARLCCRYYDANGATDLQRGKTYKCGLMQTIPLI